LHGAALGAVSAVLAALLWSLGSHTDFGSVVRCTVAALSGGIGATALTTAVIPRLLGTSVSPIAATRFASVASLPLAASGWVVALPTLTTAFIALALACALAYRSGSLGARVFLTKTGPETTRIAVATCLVATLPSLLAAPLLRMR
jgi:hypothetical protein